MADAVIQTIKTVSDMSLLDLVFVRSPPCPQLILKFHDFLHVLVLAESFTPSVINVIWTCYLSKWGRMLKALIANGAEVKAGVLSVMAALAEYAPYPVRPPLKSAT